MKGTVYFILYTTVGKKYHVGNILKGIIKQNTSQLNDFKDLGKEIYIKRRQY